MFNRNNVKSVTKYVPSIASAGSVITGAFMAPAIAEVLAAYIITGAGTLSSGWSLNIYKNASHANSRIGTTGGLDALAAYTGSDLSTYLTTTTALKKLAAGDRVLYELTVVDADTTAGDLLQFDYMYGYQE